MATAEFSKFVGILSAALSQHHLSGFEIAQLEFHHLLALFVVMLPKAHLTLHSRMSGSRHLKFTVHVLLKPGLENLGITLLACEMSAIMQQFEHSLALPFFGIGMKTNLFQSCGHC